MGEEKFDKLVTDFQDGDKMGVTTERYRFNLCFAQASQRHSANGVLSTVIKNIFF
jgi:hypothetical protein